MTTYDNRINIFNECSIALFCHLMTTILNIAIPESLVFKLGWFLIFVATFNILGNLTGMGYNTIGDMYSNCQKNKIKNKITLQIKLRLKNRIHIKEKYNMKLTHFEMNAVYMKAV